MADLNTQYQGFVETYSWEDYKRSFTLLFMGRIPTDDEFNNLLAHNPDLKERYDLIAGLSQQSLSTVQAVKVAYSGTTQAERVAWINERLQAIEARAAFIKEITDRMISNLKNLGVPDAGNIFLGIWGAAFTIAVPVVGGLISSAFNALVQSGSAKSIEREKEKLQNYANDIQQLATIKVALTKELATYDPTNEAPFVVPMWWYFAGAALLLLLYVWIRRRNQKRRKR